MKHILFVCTGNTCRSPMAEWILKTELNKESINDFTVSSAGISVIFPSGPSNHAVEVMKKDGIDISLHQSKQITNDMIKEADLILTMTVNHKDTITNAFSETADKVLTLKEYIKDTNDNRDLDISDPFGKDVSEYSKCMKEIKNCIKIIILKIKDGEL